ncbi:MAG: hypothetical protein OTI34_02285 [Lewinella sp.]|nr:hypothetical protein [Lewinella sp.]
MLAALLSGLYLTWVKNGVGEWFGSCPAWNLSLTAVIFSSYLTWSAACRSAIWVPSSLALLGVLLTATGLTFNTSQY